MAAFTLFPAKGGVKLTVRPRVPKIALMPSRLWRLALAAAATAACNEGLQPTPTCPPGFVGICGLVTVQVPLPDSLKDSTDAVFIVAYKNFPTAPESLFNFLPLPPPTVPTSNSTYPYSLKVPNGRYEWVLAVWKKKGTLTRQSADSLLREVGFYKDDGDTTTHGSGIVTVNGPGTDSIDFVIDFRTMHRICSYFPPCPP
jgi:hypothetical protein